jgi:hypothetical protein
MKKHYLDADVLYGLCETKPTMEEMELYIINLCLFRYTVTEPTFEPQPKITKIKNKSATLFIKLQNQKQLQFNSVWAKLIANIVALKRPP